MKKSIFLFLLSACVLASCNNTSSPSSGTDGSTTTSETSTTTSEDSSSTSESSTTTSEDSTSTSEESSSSSVEEIKEFTDVSFVSLTVTYDGNPHILAEVSGAPTGTTITYTGREQHVDAGVYNASATLTKEGYNIKTLNATLTINKATFDKATFNPVTVTYDGNPHSVTVSNVPASAKITYSSNVAGIKNTATDAGVYNVSAVIEDKNFITKELNTTLTINKAKFDNVTFTDETITYDGQEHSLVIKGDIPSTATVTYSSTTPGVTNSATNVGEYIVKVVLTDKNYETKEMSAKLTILKANFNNVEFKSETFEYDGKPHSISVTGNIPSTATVNYTSDVEGVTNEATEIGVYNITATISAPNFETKVLTAKLTIQTEDDERYLKWAGNNLYFQNALHDNFLYSYNNSDGVIKRISKDNAVDMISYGTERLMYVDKALLTSIKSVYYDSSTSSLERNVLLAQPCARYIQYDEANSKLYYVVNGLTQNQSGIYCTDYSGDEPVTTLLSAGKAKYLTLVANTKLYFADGLNDYKLSYILTSSTNEPRNLVVDEKIKNLYWLGNNISGALYYTVNKLAGDYIEKYTPSTAQRLKLTSDAGIDFQLINGYLYYINTDKLNSFIFGDGIYKVNINPIADNSSHGTKVATAEKGLCSFTSDGQYLYYYDMDGYKLIKADLSGNVVSNILEGFVKPDDPNPTSLGGDMETYNGVIYYLDIWDEKTLHSYNPTTKANVRLTSSKVDNFSIIGDKLYMNTVAFYVNNDTYELDLKSGTMPKRINTNDGVDFVSDGTYLYYAQDNGAGVRTAIRRTNLETLVDEEIYAKGVSNLRLVGDNLLFIDGYQIYSMDKTTFVATEIKPNNKSVHTDMFDTDGENIYYREMYSGYVLKRLSRYNLATGTYTAMATDSTDPIKIVYHNGYVYYYTDTTNAASNGIYRVEATSNATTQGECVLACNSTYYATTFTFVGNNIYFLNYKTGGLFGDSHIYEISISGGTPVKVA